MKEQERLRVHGARREETAPDQGEDPGEPTEEEWAAGREAARRAAEQARSARGDSYDGEPARDRFRRPAGVAGASQASAPGHTWGDIGLGGEVEEEHPPDLLLGIFYPDKRHLLYGETGCMKTWVGLCAAAEVLKAGKAVLWIDHELTAREIKRRLALLGCDSDERDRCRYVQPAEALGGESRAALLELLGKYDPALAVVDAFSGALGVAMLDDNSNQDVERWWQEIGNLLWGDRRCLLSLDHVNKSEGNRNRYPSGSKRKLEAADVGFEVTAIHRLSREAGQEGLVKIATMKDRLGWLPKRPGDLALVLDGEGRITWDLRPVEPSGPGGAPFRPTNLMEKVSKVIEAAGEEGLSRSAAVEGAGGKSTAAKRQAIDRLVVEGYVAEKPGARNAKILTSIRPFREADPATPPDPA